MEQPGGEHGKYELWGFFWVVNCRADHFSANAMLCYKGFPWGSTGSFQDPFFTKFIAGLKLTGKNSCHKLLSSV